MKADSRIIVASASKHWARLLHGWVTTCREVNHVSM